MLRSGQILHEKYRIENKLNEGGMGQVYRVTHIRLKRAYALKALLVLSGDEEQQIQFERQFELEAQTLAGLEHPGLTRVVDLFRENDVSYLIMELVEGVTLTDYVGNALKPLTQEVVKKLAIQILDVLEYLHGSSPPVIVRDIKPDNLMLRGDGRIKLLDFGLAKRLVLGEKTQTIVRGMGTDCYAPMEQYGQGMTDQRSDLFALGATLYFCLTGEPPPPVWQRVSVQEAMPDPSLVNPTVTSEFWAGLQHLLELDLESRPANVAEVRDLLDLNLVEANDGRSHPAGSKDTSLLSSVPHGDDYMLAGAEEFFPFSPADWLLKVVQAAVVGQARDLRITQNRSLCRVSVAIPAATVPDIREVLEALTQEETGRDLLLNHLSTGLKMVGESRNFRLILDNWRRAWLVECRGGNIQATQFPSEGTAGLRLEVEYSGKSVERAKTAAEELVSLVRKTRLCPCPIFVDERELEPGRPTDKPLLSSSVRPIYLASSSMPAEGSPTLIETATSTRLNDDRPWARFSPQKKVAKVSHLDLRCYLVPAHATEKLPSLAAYEYVTQPIKVLWYRHGVLCAVQPIKVDSSLEVLVHLDGDHLRPDAAGLRVSLPDLMFPTQLKPLQSLSQILPIVRDEIEKYKPAKPSKEASLGRFSAGFVAAPFLLLAVGIATSPILLKTALTAGVLKKVAAVGGFAGYLKRDRDEEAIRKTCLKAIDRFTLKP